jgi:peptidoglycan/LPS O-acetylase OafA/YrhL
MCGSSQTSEKMMNLQSRIPELDGIRGIAIGMVVVHHYFLQPIQPPAPTFLLHLHAVGRLAWSGVDLFFVLSGFLIGGILLDARDAPNYFRVFYSRRFFRIVPVYFAFLGVAVALSVLGTSVFGQYFAWIFHQRLPWLPHFLFLQNFWMARRSTFGATGMGVTWSLAVEEQFYLSLPTVIRLFNGRLLTFALAFGIVLAPLSRIVLMAFAPSHALSGYVLMPCRADALVLGVAAAALLRNDCCKQWILNRRYLPLVLLIPLTVAVGLLTRIAPDPFGRPMMAIGYTCLALFYVCVLLCALLYKEGWFGSLLRSPWLTWLGSIAYGVYLFHELVLHCLRSVLRLGVPERWSPEEFLVSLAALAFTLVICQVSWTLLEKPLIRLGHRAQYERHRVDGTDMAGAVALEGTA